MPPKRACSCSAHASTEVDNGNVYRISGKKYKRKVIEYLVSEGLLQPYHTYLCEACYTNGLDKIEDEDGKLDDEPKLYTFEEFVHCIEDECFDDVQNITLFTMFGKIMRKKLGSVKSCTDSSFLQQLNADDYLGNADENVLAFLNALALNDSDKKVKILNAYEHLVSLVVTNYIGALNFALNLITYFISGSRNIVDLGSRYSPAGSYSYVLNYLNKTSLNALKPPPNSDICVFFDNNQIMARNWNVKYNSKALISVITTMVSLVPPIITTLQKNPQYKPYVWLSSIDIKEAGDVEKDRIFRIERNKFILKYIEILHKEIEQETSAPAAKKPKVDGKTDPYGDVESHVTGKTDIKMMNPIMVNPCSYASLETVLDNIIINSNREWVEVGCDGLPFILCSRIIENYHVCPCCKELFKKKGDFIKHVNVHPVDDISACKKYGNILLIPGMGHMEINITKGIFKLLWKVMLKDLAIMLGWKSIKALTACENCTDHHKAWQILQILFSACTRAILKPYVRQCINESTPTSLSGLYSFLAQQSPNYMFMFKCNFTFLFALTLFRSSVRRSNFIFLSVAMHKLSPLFYGLNMTSYMEITLRFENMLKKTPTEIQKFISQTITCSQSGHQSKAEGGDFILEAVNKKVKSWMPPGVPTEDRWIRVCRNLPCMDSIKKNLEQKLGEAEEQSVNPYFR